MNTELKFPEMPGLQVTYVPVQFEPIIHSGERITVALAAFAPGVDPVVSVSLTTDALKCAFGKEGIGLFNIAEETARDLEKHLKEGQPIDTWNPVFERITLGPKRETAADDMTKALRIGMRNTACFSAMLSNGTEKEASFAQSDSNRWRKQVQDTVVDREPKFVERFNRPFRVRPGAAEAHVDYAGQNLAANFTMLLPGNRRWEKVNLAKAKLFTLQELRVATETFPVNHYELIMYRPDEADPRYSDKQMNLFNETILELEDAADKFNLRLVPVLNAEEAAERIFQQEQAA